MNNEQIEIIINGKTYIATPKIAEDADNKHFDLSPLILREKKYGQIFTDRQLFDSGLQDGSGGLITVFTGTWGNFENIAFHLHGGSITRFLPYELRWEFQDFGEGSHLLIPTKKR